MLIIQALDHEEGSCARWRDVSKHQTRDTARTQLRKMRAADDEECLCSYRIAEEGSDAYYSQPSDKAEY